MSIARANYQERQRLTAADLRQEQDYRLSLMGLHAVAHHRYGVVRGLRVVRDEGGPYRLTPGVAIDGHGREIVVTEELELDLSNVAADGCSEILLYYCEDAERDSAAGRPCTDDTPTRIRQRPLVRLRPRADAEPSPIEELQRARAAGTSGLAPWPVLIATYGRGCQPSAPAPGALIDYTRTVYAGLRAALLTSPRDASTMQIGLSSQTDFFHFLLRTGGTAPQPRRRIGIDRDGDVHFWDSLLISASKASGTLAIGHQLALQFSATMPAGIGSRVRIEGLRDATLKTISQATLLEVDDTARSLRPVLRVSEAKLKHKATLLEFGAGRSTLLQLLDTDKRRLITFETGHRRLLKDDAPPASAASAAPISTVQAPPTQLAPAASTTPQADTAFSITLAPADAQLQLMGAPNPGAADDAAPALLFKPAATMKADPLARELRAVVTSAPGAIEPTTALRICGGEGDDDDVTTRLSIGARAGMIFDDALQMDSARRVLVASLDGKQAAMQIEGTTHLPPIGPKDPLLPDLLVLTHVYGLWKAGNVARSTAPILTLDADVIALEETGIAYTLTVAWTSAIAIKRTFELITAADGTGDLTFRSLDIAATGNTGSVTTTVQIDHYTRPDPQVKVVVVMLVEAGGKVQVCLSNAVLKDKPSSSSITS